LTYILLLTVWVYLHSTFLVGSVTIYRLFLQECARVSAVKGHPRSLILLRIERIYMRLPMLVLPSQ